MDVHARSSVAAMGAPKLLLQPTVPYNVEIVPHGFRRYTCAPPDFW